MLSQLMALSETLKYSAAVVEIEEKVNHYSERQEVLVSDGSDRPRRQDRLFMICSEDHLHTSQLTTIFSKTSCASPQNRRL